MKNFEVAILETREEMVVYFVTAENENEAIEKALNFEFGEVKTESGETVNREVKIVEEVEKDA